MSPDDSALLDLAIAARRVAEFISGMDWNEFERDLKTQSAVQHQFIGHGRGNQAVERRVSRRARPGRME